MPFDVRTDKRILERELHTRGQAFSDEITRLRKEAKDFGDRAVRHDGDVEELRNELADEKALRDERIVKELERSTARHERSRGEED